MRTAAGYPMRAWTVRSRITAWIFRPSRVGSITARYPAMTPDCSSRLIRAETAGCDRLTRRPISVTPVACPFARPLVACPLVEWPLVECPLVENAGNSGTMSSWKLQVSGSIIMFAAARRSCSVKRAFCRLRCANTDAESCAVLAGRRDAGRRRRSLRPRRIALRQAQGDRSRGVITARCRPSTSSG